MIDVLGIDHINLNVKELGQSVAFYKNVFGFKVLEEGVSSSGSKYAIIGSPGAAYLCFYEGKRDIESGDLNHIGFHVANFDSVMKILKDLNVKREFGDEYIKYPKSRSIYIYDLDGYEIEISEKFGGNLA